MVIAFLAIIVIFMVIAIAMLIIVATKPELLSRLTGKAGYADSGDGTSTISPNEIIGDTKSFILVKSFEDFAMDLGRHNYRAIVECSSVNYDLKSYEEQQMIEGTYSRFLNSLSFPIQIYVQTREFNKGTMLEHLHSNIASSIQRFPSMENYSNRYEEEMQYITEYLNNSKIKKKYIIVPFNNTDLLEVSALTKAEIKEFALSELKNRCNVVVGGLEGVGLTAKLLNRSEIAEVLYSYYHRDTYAIAEDIINGTLTTLSVTGERGTAPTDRMTLDAILLEAQNKIKTEMYKADSSAEEQNFYKYIFDVLESFKQDDKGKNIDELMNNAGINTDEENGIAPVYPYQVDEYGTVEKSNIILS